MDEILWDLFKKTGDIKYYLLIKRVEGENNEVTEDRGDNSRRNQL